MALPLLPKDASLVPNTAQHEHLAGPEAIITLLLDSYPAGALQTGAGTLGLACTLGTVLWSC